MCVAKIARYVKKRCATTSGALCGPVGVVQEGRQRGEIPLGPGSGKWEIHKKNFFLPIDKILWSSTF